MNVPYLALRLGRRWTPAPVARALLGRALVLLPGGETLRPAAVAERYAHRLREAGATLEGARVLILGYGGHLGVAVDLLRRGAAHVWLCDPYAPLDDRRNATLLPEFEPFLLRRDGHVEPRPERITLVPRDVRHAQAAGELPPLDVVLSRSVYEHLDDVDAVTAALARATAPRGVHIHTIDLRDHVRRWPFEMLCYSEATWRRWLDPPTHLNRRRLPDFRRVFEAWFEDVAIDVVRADPESLRRTRRRIRPEFLTGDDDVDAVTVIRVVARRPRPGGAVASPEAPC